jgi:hypothetical protein
MAKAITAWQYKQRISWLIIRFTIFFGLVLFAMYAVGAYDDEEIIRVAQILAPIHSMYVSAVMRYIANNSYQPEADSSPQLTGLMSKVSTWLIWGHILALLSIVLLGGFNLMDKPTVNIWLMGIETAFGIYIGWILNTLFKSE